jgi:tryptophan halogenase
VRNVVGVGLSSGFLEPLESTSIYLAQAAIQQLTGLFPIGGIDEKDRNEFNRIIDVEYDRIRDFLILHYHATERDDSSFWDHVRTMEVPDSLLEKIELFRRSGRVVRYGEGLFYEPSWISVMIGQGILPEAWDQRADAIEPVGLALGMDRLRAQIAEKVVAMPDHAVFLAARNAGVAEAG